MGMCCVLGREVMGCGEGEICCGGEGDVLGDGGWRRCDEMGDSVKGGKVDIMGVLVLVVGVLVLWGRSGGVYMVEGGG